MRNFLLKLLINIVPLTVATGLVKVSNYNTTDYVLSDFYQEYYLSQTTKILVEKETKNAYFFSKSNKPIDLVIKVKNFYRISSFLQQF